MRKRLLSFVLILCLLILSFSAFAEDYSTKSDDELYSLINQIRAELETRNQNEEKIISQADGITVYLNDVQIEESYDGTHNLELKVTAVNSGDEYVGIIFEKVSINGWEITALDSVDLDAGKKTKAQFSFYDIEEKAEIKTIEEIEEIEFYSYSFDPNSFMTILY